LAGAEQLPQLSQLGWRRAGQRSQGGGALGERPLLVTRGLDGNHHFEHERTPLFVVNCVIST
jgi:hypothetical protein